VWLIDRQTPKRGTQWRRACGLLTHDVVTSCDGACTGASAAGGIDRIGECTRSRTPNRVNEYARTSNYSTDEIDEAHGKPAGNPAFSWVASRRRSAAASLTSL
jgi:hypothetical protein